MKKIKLEKGVTLSIPEHPNEDLERKPDDTLRKGIGALVGIALGLAVLYDIFHPEPENETKQIEKL